MPPKLLNQESVPFRCAEHGEAISELDKGLSLVIQDVDSIKESQREFKEDLRSIKSTQQEIRDDVRDFKADKRWAAAIAGATGSVIALGIQVLFSAFK